LQEQKDGWKKTGEQREKPVTLYNHPNYRPFHQYQQQTKHETKRASLVSGFDEEFHRRSRADGRRHPGEEHQVTHG